MMNAMLVSYGLSQNIWSEAILTANYFLNIVPRKKLDKNLYELFKGRSPTYNFLRTWGCLAKVVVPPPKKEKIGLKPVDVCSLVMHKITEVILGIKITRTSDGLALF